MALGDCTEGFYDLRGRGSVEELPGLTSGEGGLGVMPLVRASLRLSGLQSLYLIVSMAKEPLQSYPPQGRIPI